MILLKFYLGWVVLPLQTNKMNQLKAAQISDYQFKSPLFKWVGYVCLGLLVILAAMFYQERSLFIDIAYQTFLMIKDGTVQVQVYRFGSAIVQVLPLLAIKLGLPLKVVLLFYSLSFTLLFLIFYWIIVRVLRNDYMGWVLVFLFTLMVYDAFYWATSEYQQGLAFLLVVFAFVLRYPKLDSWQQWVLLVPFTVALAYYHPLVFIIFLFLWVFFLLRNSDLRHWRYWALLGTMFLVVGFKSKFSGNWYDDNKYRIFFDNLTKHFPNYFAFESHQKFLEDVVQHWYLLPIFLLIIGIWYIRKRAWLKLGWILAFSFGYLMLLHISSPTATYRFYAEVNYMPLSIVVMIPFIFDIAPKIKKERLVLFLFGGIVLLRLITISLNHKPYTQRLTWIKSQLEQNASAESNRLLYELDEKTRDTLLMTWGVAYESLLISAMEDPDSARTLVILPKGKRYDQALQSDTLFVTELIEYSIEEVDGKYYRLGDKAYLEVGAEKAE